jgi:hypothetical protein
MGKVMIAGTGKHTNISAEEIRRRLMLLQPF